MIKKHTVLKTLMCFMVFLMPFVNIRSAFADGPSFELLGSKNISIENNGVVNGKYSLMLKVNDMKDVYSFQLSELMLVSDCTFYIGKSKWGRPEQEKNEFPINWNMNGTYAFYVFHNGKVLAYARFRLKGFKENGGGGGSTFYSGKMATYYDLPDLGIQDPNDYADLDGKNDGICTREGAPDKPQGSGDIDDSKKEEDKGGDNGGNKKPYDPEDYFKKLLSKLDEVGNKIPPPPDWDKVSDIFADKIGNKMSEVIGKTPDPPSPPPIPDMPGIDTGGLENHMPDIKDNPDLKDSGFTADDIKKEAKPIEEKKDESGGFDIGNPLDNLPETPKELPKPGETEKSGWTQDKPKEPTGDLPTPKDKDKGEPPKPTKPNTDNEKPPKPSVNDDKPPKPGNNDGNPPKPGGNDTSPPRPGDNGGNPPKPGGNDTSPPRPGDNGGNPPKPNG
ncbi:proline-rich domain-containing protein, partial [Bacillus paranthracis]